MKSSYRRVGILIDGYSMAEFCKDGKFTIENSPIPKGAKFLRAFHDTERDSFILYFDHRSFELIKTGERIPIIQMQRKGKLTTIFKEVKE